MARPTPTRVSKKAKLNEPGKIVLQPPSGRDIGNDISAALYPLLQLGLSIATGAIKGSLSAFLSDPITAFGNSTSSTVKDTIAGINGVSEALGAKDSPARRSWNLIRNALIKAVANLIDEQKHLFPTDAGRLMVLEFALEEAPRDIEITSSFLQSPRVIFKRLPILPALESSLRASFLVDGKMASLMASQLERLFDIAVWSEYHASHDYYRPVVEALNSSFAGPARWISALDEHEARTRLLNQAPVMGTAFPLSKVYLELRGVIWVTSKRSGAIGHYKVVGSQEYMKTWIETREFSGKDWMLFAGAPAPRR